MTTTEQGQFITRAGLKMKKSLFLIEDEDLLCELFAEYIQIIPNLVYLGDARDGMTAVRKCFELEPDIVVVDIRMPEMNGLEILKCLSERLPTAKIIIFSGTVDDDCLRIAMEYQTDAYIEKAYGLDELRRGIEYVMMGRKYYSPGIMRLLTNYQVS